MRGPPHIESVGLFAQSAPPRPLYEPWHRERSIGTFYEMCR
jgi:hypothetical protein